LFNCSLHLLNHLDLVNTTREVRFQFLFILENETATSTTMRLATRELQNGAQTRERNLLFRSYVYAPFEVLREKCSSPVLDECQKIYSNRTKQFSPLCVRERSSISPSLPRRNSLWKISNDTRKLHAMQRNNDIGSHNWFLSLYDDILYLLMIYFSSLNILNWRRYNSIEHRRKAKTWST